MLDTMQRTVLVHYSVIQTTYIQATGNRSVRLHPTTQLFERFLPTIDDGVDKGLAEDHTKLSKDTNQLRDG